MCRAGKKLWPAMGNRKIMGAQTPHPGALARSQVRAPPVPDPRRFRTPGMTAELSGGGGTGGVTGRGDGCLPAGR